MRALFIEELPYDPNQVTPGVIGFAATALVAVAVMLLMWDFNRRVRRINDREEAKERLLAEIAAAGGGTPEAGEQQNAGEQQSNAVQSNAVQSNAGEQESDAVESESAGLESPGEGRA